MTRRLLVTPARLSADGGPLTLTAAESRYLLRVLRLAPGSAVEVRDGRGGRWPATLDGQGGLMLEPRQRLEEPPGPAVTLAFAPAKGKRLDYLLEKAAELGAYRLQPITTTRSVRVPGDNAANRYQRIVDAGARQSAGARAPEVLPPLSFSRALAAVEADLRLLPDPEAPAALRDVLIDPAPASVVVFTGPEGGFTDAERAEAEEAGVQAVRLGTRILRAETAPLVVLTLLQHRFGDLG